jgi:hypothetical protein
MSFVAVARRRADASGETDLGRKRGYLRMVRRFMTRFGVALSVAAVVLSLGAGAALGGEITGNGKDLEVNGRSLCAYSGLNDEVTAEEPGRVQNWGSIPKEFRDFLTSIGVSPGVACNPTSGFEE